MTIKSEKSYRKHHNSVEFSTHADRQVTLEEWNLTYLNSSHAVCIHQLFEAQVERTPDAIAIAFENQHLTYQQLNQRANQLAHHLQTQGVGPEVLVGIYTERSLEMIIGLLGILKAGGAYVPLDPAYPAERLAFILEDTQVPVILTQASLVKNLPPQQSSVICLDSGWEVISHQSKENPIGEAIASNLMYVIYTSGSTGKPKGVMITHAGICNQLHWRQTTFPLTGTDRVLQNISFSFDPSVWQIFWPLTCGAQLILPCLGGQKDSAYLVELIAQQQISVIALVPSMLRVFLEEKGIEQCRCLKHVFCGGEALPLDLQERFFERLNLDHVLHNVYGPTEASIDATFWTCKRGTTHSIAPIGQAIANTQVYILDSNLQPAAIGEPGELHIAGAGLARGYLNRPDLTSEKFIPNPFAVSSPSPPVPRTPHPTLYTQLYKTGDLARYLPDGNIEFLGRIDDQVKIRGFRIELGEIEAVLNQHPLVSQSVVIVREDVPGSKRLVAYIVPVQEMLVIGDLRRFLQEKLPEPMVPAVFVILKTLPLNTNGKVDRRALLAPEFVSQELNSAAESSFVAPRDRIEQQLTEIWQEFLGVRSIGIQDNFYDLGGHSLIAVRLWAKVEKVFNQDLPLATLFQAPTIEQLAQHLRQPGSTLKCPALAVIQPGKAGSSKPPLFCIHVHGRGMKYYRPLTRHLDPEQPIYGLSIQYVKEPIPIDRTEDLAAYYIQQIKILQPDGPYLLVGFSFGGLIAFEMAQQLRTQGQQVALLGLFDTMLPTISQGGLALVREQVVESLHKLTKPHSIDLAQLFKSQVQMVQDLGRWLWFKCCKLAIIYYQIVRLPLPEYLENFNQVLENARIGKAYSPQPYSGLLTLFKAGSRQDNVDVESGWCALAGNLEVHEVPGDHTGMFCEPAVGVLSQKLQRCIDRAIATDTADIRCQGADARE